MRKKKEIKNEEKYCYALNISDISGRDFYEKGDKELQENLQNEI